MFVKSHSELLLGKLEPLLDLDNKLNLEQKLIQAENQLYEVLQEDHDKHQAYLFG